MKACLKAASLEDYTNAITVTTSEALLTSPENGGWQVRATDNAHVCMVNATLDPDSFSAHQPSDDSVAVDWDKLSDVIGLSNGDEQTEVHTGDGSMTVLFGNITRRLGLLDGSGMTVPNIPDLEPTATAEVELRHLKKAVRATDAITDHTTFKATTDGLIVSAKGDIDDVTYKLPSASLKHFNVDEPARSMYSNGYLFQILKGCAAGKVRLAWSDDHPVSIAWEANGVDVEYLLAPRIESA